MISRKTMRLTLLTCLAITVLTGCTKPGILSETAPTAGSDPKEAGEPPVSITKPLDALQDICYRRNYSYSLARKASPESRAVTKSAYEELQASGNSFVDTLSVAVRNKQKQDFSRFAQDVKNDVEALRSTVEAVHASDFPSWFAPLMALAERAITIAVEYKNDKREAFAKDLQTTCRWDDFDKVNPPPM